MKLTKTKFFTLLTQIEMKYNCTLQYSGERYGSFWFHQTIEPWIEAYNTLKTNKVPIRSCWAEFDTICGRYVLKFTVPRHIKVLYENKE